MELSLREGQGFGLQPVSHTVLSGPHCAFRSWDPPTGEEGRGC